MRRPQPVTKDDVVAAAAQLFEERGYQSTRADDIAEALKIAKPTLYSRTQGKAELLEAIMDLVMDVISEMDDDASHLHEEAVAPLTALERLFVHHVQKAVAYQSYFAVVLMDERELPADSRARVRKWGERYTRRVRDLIAAGIADGTIRDDLDPHIAANTLLASANWVCVWYRDDGRLSADDIASQMWLVISGGLQAPATGPKRAGRRAKS